MRAITLMTAQLVSLLILTASANGLFEKSECTIAFVLSFITFASCSVYIGKHQKHLLREVNNHYQS